MKLDSEESVEDAANSASNYHALLREMPRYSCPVEIFILFFSFIEI